MTDLIVLIHEFHQQGVFTILMVSVFKNSIVLLCIYPNSQMLNPCVTFVIIKIWAISFFCTFCWREFICNFFWQSIHFSCFFNKFMRMKELSKVCYSRIFWIFLPVNNLRNFNDIFWQGLFPQTTWRNTDHSSQHERN